MPKRFLYIKVDEHESRGHSYDDGDGSAWSGFSHSVIHVNSWGPVYFAENGKGWGHKRVNDGHYHYNFNFPVPDEESLVGDIEYLYLVVVRYGDGGTFGRTDGYYDFPGVFLSADEAYAFARKHEKDFEQAHNGYFESYDGWTVECVEFKDESDVEQKGWKCAAQEADSTIYPLEPGDGTCITVRQLKEWLSQIPDDGPYGEPGEVWIGTADNISNPCMRVSTLNLRERDGVQCCDIILEP